MKNYYNFLAERKIVNHKIRLERKRLHKQLFAEYRWNFIIMDIMVILLLLMNMGALMMTNMMVYKTASETGKKVIMKEVNPIATEMHGYDPHPQNYKLFVGIIKQILIWVGLIIIYLYYRQNIYSDLGLFAMNAIVTLYTIAIFQDFFNNLGYVLGKQVFV